MNPNDLQREKARKLTGDYLVRAIGLGSSVRALAVRSTDVGAALVEAQKAMPTAGVALTRLATACLLLGGTVKGREQVSIEIRCSGPLEGLYAIANSRGDVRVTVRQPFIHLPPRDDGKFDLGAAIGEGQLVVVKNLGLKDPYTGVVPLVSGEIANDLVHYFQTSEQKPTAMGLGEIVEKDGVKVAGGFLLQVFPDADDDALTALEERVAEMRPISELLSEGSSPEEILRLLLPDLEILESYPVQFQCTCSRERYERILITLGEKELGELIEQGEAALTCHFCNSDYKYDREDLETILAEALRRDDESDSEPEA